MSASDPLTFAVMNEIGIIDQLASTTMGAALPAGLSIAQFSILNHFVRREVAFQSPASLASAFQVSRPTMTNTLMRLEKAALVTITPDPDDRRAKRVAITPKGRSTREESLARLAGPISEAEAVLGPDLLAKVHPLLVEIREKLDALRD